MLTKISVMINRSKRLRLSHLLGETIPDQLQQMQTTFIFLTVIYLYLINITNCLSGVWFFKCSVFIFQVISSGPRIRRESVCTLIKVQSSKKATRSHQGKKNTQPTPGSMCVHVDWLTVCYLVTVSKHESYWHVKKKKEKWNHHPLNLCQLLFLYLAKLQ